MLLTPLKGSPISGLTLICGLKIYPKLIVPILILDTGTLKRVFVHIRIVCIHYGLIGLLILDVLSDLGLIQTDGIHIISARPE